MLYYEQIYIFVVDDKKMTSHAEIVILGESGVGDCWFLHKIQRVCFPSCKSWLDAMSAIRVMLDSGGGY